MHNEIAVSTKVKFSHVRSAGVYYTHFPTINHEWSTETNTAI